MHICFYCIYILTFLRMARTRMHISFVHILSFISCFWGCVLLVRDIHPANAQVGNRPDFRAFEPVTRRRWPYANLHKSVGLRLGESRDR